MEIICLTQYIRINSKKKKLIIKKKTELLTQELGIILPLRVVHIQMYFLRSMIVLGWSTGYSYSLELVKYYNPKSQIPTVKLHEIKTDSDYGHLN